MKRAAVKGVRHYFIKYLQIRVFSVEKLQRRAWDEKLQATEIPAHKLGRLWRFKISEIDEWVRSGKSVGINEAID